MTGEKRDRNDYLEAVMAENESVERELEHRSLETRDHGGANSLAPSCGNHGRSVIDYRVTGFWRFKTVVVPPHVYAVHTRRGKRAPINIGLGISFRFDPCTDSYLLVPATVQTLLIGANAICREKQGISVQAYVQWIVDDVSVAYRKLDFSDPVDPMRIVNVQLREQAKAAIQDKVAMMALEDVLSDKQPIIEELTNRLRQVAEGRGEDGPDSGLGLKIVTVQIRDAVVRSAKLWENLQSPYRADQDRIARLAEIHASEQVDARDLESRTMAETAAQDSQAEINRLRARHEREKYDLERSEAERRLTLEAERERSAISIREETERKRRESELALQLQAFEQEKRKIEEECIASRERAKLDAAESLRAKEKAGQSIEIEELQSEALCRSERKQLELAEEKRRIENVLTEENLKAMIVRQLPEIARALPAPKEMKTFSFADGCGSGGAAPLLGFIASAMGIMDSGTGSKKQ